MFLVCSVCLQLTSPVKAKFCRVRLILSIILFVGLLCLELDVSGLLSLCTADFSSKG